MATPRKWPRKRDVFARVNRVIEHQRQDDIAPATSQGSAGGGSVLPWVPVDDSWLGAGVSNNTVGTGDLHARIAYDHNLFYMRGLLNVDPAGAGGGFFASPDTGWMLLSLLNPPTLDGFTGDDFVNTVAYVHTFQTIVGVSNSGGRTTGELDLTLQLGDATVPTGHIAADSGVFVHANESFDPTTGFTVCLDGVVIAF